MDMASDSDPQYCVVQHNKGQSDDSEGVIGRAFQSKAAGKTVVRWFGRDEGSTNEEFNQYELDILQVMSKVDHSVPCSVCKGTKIRGLRYQCCSCDAYNLCSTCFHGKQHNLDHPFRCCIYPGSLGLFCVPRTQSKFAHIAKPELGYSEGYFKDCLPQYGNECSACVVKNPRLEGEDDDQYRAHVGIVGDNNDVRQSNRKYVGVSFTVNMPRTYYFAGRKNKFDLLLLDSSGIGVTHLDVNCDNCQESHIEGYRWQCSDCPSVNLCTSCYMSDIHGTSHQFLRYDLPSYVTQSPVCLTPRESESSVDLQGPYKDVLPPGWAASKYYPGHLPFFGLENCLAIPKMGDTDSPNVSSASMTHSLKISSGSKELSNISGSSLSMGNVPEKRYKEPEHDPNFKVTHYDTYLFSTDSQYSLGQGCYGDVYKGYCRKKEALVAVKRLRNSKPDEKKSKPYENELRCQVEISPHPNLVRMFDFMRFENTMFMIIEYCNYGTLDEFYKSMSGRMTDHTNLDLMTQIARGLSALHAKMVHLDIKPSNILISLESAKKVQPQAKLADYGLSKLNDDMAGESMLASSRSARLGRGGPMHFSAPELITSGDQKPVSSVDVFSTGLVFAGMLRYSTNKDSLYICPSKEITSYGQAFNLKSQYPALEIEPVITRADGVSDSVSLAIEVILEMVEFSPADRLSSEAVYAKLKKVLDADKTPPADVIYKEEKVPQMYISAAKSVHRKTKPHTTLATSVTGATGSSMAGATGSSMAGATGSLHSKLNGHNLGDIPHSSTSDRSQSETDGDLTNEIFQAWKYSLLKTRQQEGHFGPLSETEEETLKTQFNQDFQSESKKKDFKAAIMKKQATDFTKNAQKEFYVGDVVMVIANKDIFQKLQTERNVFHPSQLQMCGLKGVVRAVDDDGDILVEMVFDLKHVFYHPSALHKVPLSERECFQKGDIVLITNDADMMEMVETPSRTWTKDLAQYCGNLATVEETSEKDDTRVKVKAQDAALSFNKTILSFVAEASEVICHSRSFSQSESAIALNSADSQDKMGLLIPLLGPQDLDSQGVFFPGDFGHNQTGNKPAKRALSQPIQQQGGDNEITPVVMSASLYDQPASLEYSGRDMGPNISLKSDQEYHSDFAGARSLEISECEDSHASNLINVAGDGVESVAGHDVDGVVGASIGTPEQLNHNQIPLSPSGVPGTDTFTLLDHARSIDIHEEVNAQGSSQLSENLDATFNQGAVLQDSTIATSSNTAGQEEADVNATFVKEMATKAQSPQTGPTATATSAVTPATNAIATNAIVATNAVAANAVAANAVAANAVAEDETDIETMVKSIVDNVQANLLGEATGESANVPRQLSVRFRGHDDEAVPSGKSVVDLSSSSQSAVSAVNVPSSDPIERSVLVHSIDGPHNTSPTGGLQHHESANLSEHFQFPNNLDLTSQAERSQRSEDPRSDENVTQYGKSVVDVSVTDLGVNFNNEPAAEEVARDVEDQEVVEDKEDEGDRAEVANETANSSDHENEAQSSEHSSCPERLSERAVFDPQNGVHLHNGQQDYGSGFLGQRSQHVDEEEREFVVRGPDWKLDKHDNVGVVVKDQPTTVLWPSGEKTKHKKGDKNTFELRLLAVTGKNVQHNSRCANKDCRQSVTDSHIRGLVWTCGHCSKSLCNFCFHKGIWTEQDEHSPFYVSRSPEHIGWFTHDRSGGKPIYVNAKPRGYEHYNIPPMFFQQSLPLYGLASSISVIRGPNWKSRGIDGGRGTVGETTDIRLFKNEKQTVNIKWMTNPVMTDSHVAGKDGICELRILDISGLNVYHENPCMSCKERIYGFAWSCNGCSNGQKMCSSCFFQKLNDKSHLKREIYRYNFQGADRTVVWRPNPSKQSLKTTRLKSSDARLISFTKCIEEFLPPLEIKDNRVIFTRSSETGNSSGAEASTAQDGIEDPIAEEIDGLRVISYKGFNIAPGPKEFILGAGGFGQVHLGFDHERSSYVAIKHILKYPSKSKEAGELKVEVRTFKLVSSHENLVKLYDSFEWEGYVFLVTEYCHLGSLGKFYDFIGQHSDLERLTLEFMIHIASGLAHLHGFKDQAGKPHICVHRDIKPDNIVIYPGSWPVAKICDFGLAKLIAVGDKHPAAVLAYLTDNTADNKKTIAGTRFYWPPEISQKKARPSVDVFSTGLLFLGMLTWDPQIKFSITPDLQVVGKHLHQRMKTAEEPDHCLTRHDITIGRLEPLYYYIQTMIAYDPEMRPDMKNVLTCLKVYKSGLRSHDLSPAVVRSIQPKSILDVPSAFRQSRASRNYGHSGSLSSVGQSSSTSFRQSSSRQPPQPLPRQSLLSSRLPSGSNSETIPKVPQDHMVSPRNLGTMPKMPFGSNALRGGSEAVHPDGNDYSKRSATSGVNPFGRQRSNPDSEDVADSRLPGHQAYELCIDRIRKEGQKLNEPLDQAKAIRNLKTFKRTLFDIVTKELSENYLKTRLEIRRVRRMFQEGAVVMVTGDALKLEQCQRDRDLYSDVVDKSLGLKGVVHHVDADGDVCVWLITETFLYYHPECLDVSIQTERTLSEHDLVVLNEEASFEYLKKAHYHVAHVVMVNPDSTVTITCKTFQLTVDQSCLTFLATSDDLFNALTSQYI